MKIEAQVNRVRVALLYYLFVGFVTLVFSGCVSCMVIYLFIQVVPTVGILYSEKSEWVDLDRHYCPYCNKYVSMKERRVIDGEWWHDQCVLKQSVKEYKKRWKGREKSDF